ncbi:sulfotransferase domain-containing protein [Pacificimonas sp. WHA3]|uniref:Sulfotransferase domain-containing protein n=2 Tax=Pacificimonas pallii TaxID=2827236 RepID=A0ABS6SBL1_9SPHN|nr:sulfotransferase domain-containing protein [Pacificimonas pallii]
MLHVAMSAFRGVELWPEESSATTPTLSERRDIAARFRKRNAASDAQNHLITKRNFGWFHRTETDEMIAKVRQEDMGLILMIRDPRDVMLSRHSASDSDDAYVDPEHWVRSIRAGEHLAAHLADEPRFLTVNYEELVQSPGKIETQLGECFGLSLRDGSPGLGAVKANFDASKGDFEPYIIQALHGVRDMSPASVGKWQHEKADPAAILRKHADAGPVFLRFCSQYGYPYEVALPDAAS